MNAKQVKMVTFALILGNIMSGLDATIVNTAIPAIVSALHGLQFMGWIVAIYLLGMSISIPIWTKVGEKITNKLAFEISLLLFIIGSACEGLAPNMYSFLLARLIMGVGGGGMGSLPYIIAGYIFKNIKRRTKVLGDLSASFNAAAIMGPLIGGWIIDSFSWHWVFYLNVPIGLVAVLICVFFYQPVTTKQTPVFDLAGSAFLVVSLLSFLFGLQLLGLSSPYLVAGLIALSFILLLIFFRHERIAPNPVIPLAIFKKKTLNGDFLLFAFTWGAYIAVNTYLPMWAQALLGMSALLGGMTLIPNSLMEVIAAQTVATIHEHLRVFTIVLIGIIMMIISSGGMLLAQVQTPLWLLTMIGACAGIGVGFIFVILQVKVQVDAGLKEMPTATSTSYLIRILAQTVMSAVYGVIMNLALAQGIGNHPQISMGMMNRLSNAHTARNLPQNLLPLMRNIFHSGLQDIMAVSILLLLIALVFNFYFNWSTTKK